MGVSLYISLVIFIITCSYVLYNFCTNYTRKRKLQWLPAVPGWPMIGAALEFGGGCGTILDDADRLIKQYGKIIYMDLVMQSNILTTDYDFVEYLLSTQDVLTKSVDYRFLHNWLGTGLLTSEGEKWRARRKLITPAFHFSFLEKFTDVFEQNLDILMWELKNEVNEDFTNIYSFLNRFALDAICEAAMGVSINAQKDKQLRYAKNVREMCRISMDRIFSIAKKSDTLYAFCPDFYKEKKAVQELHAMTYSVIDARRKELELNGTKHFDESVGEKERMTFLDILLRSTIDGEPLSREDIREEVDTFMFEGHDTISSAASFALYLLAMHPEVQKRAVEEQKHIFHDDINRKATYNDLLEMKYLENVIKETLRLYPPVPLLGRVTTQDIQYKGNIIPKDVNILVVSYSILRDPDNFENPEKFDPDRFENNDGTRPYSYIPFSAGPRNCIGQKFAMLELKSILSRTLRNFELHPPTIEHKMVLIAEAVLKSSNGVRVRLARREWSANWRKQRRMLNPSFHVSNLSRYIEVFEKNGGILAKKLEKEGDNDSVDIYPLMNLCTLDIICEAAMGISVNAQTNSKSEFLASLASITDLMVIRTLVPLPDWLYCFTPMYFREKRMLKTYHSFTEGVIERRIESLQNESGDEFFDEKKRMNFLDLLLKTEVDGRPLNRTEIRDQVDTFMFGGQDTTASSMTFILYCLAHHPEVQEKAYQEQKLLFGGNVAPEITIRDLQDMKYLEAVIKETMRMYSPAPFIARKIEEELEWNGMTFPKDTDIVLFLYDIHQNPEVFPEPEKFKPERFEDDAGKYQYNFVPFSAGPRNCIGKMFGMLETKSVVSKILRNFLVLPAKPHQEVKLSPKVVLAPINGCYVSFRKR
ncbi:probable cytochrome P450 4d14 [Anoplophora glabripennis]|uniref:probable cytochrome P450 4d14 n=1 Tax=Anoplophora glabripennis TaxID=217634 RepID=UPI000C76FF71|nr:probable cytochrome P450 4d14 [Anoplophora glabripennis]